MFDPASYSFNIFAVPLLLVLLTVIVLGGVVVVREGIGLVSVSFGLAVVSASIWLFCFAALYSAREVAVALVWAHAAYLGIPFIPPAVYQFTRAVLGIAPRANRATWLAWLLAECFALIGVTTPWLVGSVQQYWWGYYPRFGVLGLAFTVFFFGTLGASLAHYWREYRTTPTLLRKQRTRWLMIAFAIGYVGCIDFVALYGVPLYPFGYLAVFGFLIVATRVILRYRLVDITPAFAANHILATMTDALLVLDQEGVVRLTNPAAHDLFDGTGTALVGQPLASVLGSAPFAGDLPAQLANQTIHSYEWTFQSPHGVAHDLNLAASAMREADGQTQAIICIIRDVTERRQAEEAIRQLNADLERRVHERTQQLQQANHELESEIAERRQVQQALQQLATHDELTGLYNRREFGRLLREELARSRRFGHSLALLMLDIDHFKWVNDTYGHPAGDQVLREVARSLRETVRATDRVARYGGEELALLLPETPAGQASRFAENLRVRIATRPFGVTVGDGRAPINVRITVSVGVAGFPDDALSEAGLIQAADAALYAAKRHGRNRAVRFAPHLAATGRPQS